MDLAVPTVLLNSELFHFCRVIGCALGLVARATVHLVGGVDAQPALGLGGG